MENKQLTQFTFYELYWTLIKQLSDEAAGRLATNICNFMFTDEEVPELSDKLENYYWHNILDILSEDKEIELQGKIPKTLNRTMRHFTFLNLYFEAMQLMQDNIQRGIFIKAICEFMFEGKERKLKPPIEQHFELAKRKLLLSRTRKKVGSIGGKTPPKPITAKEVAAMVPKGLDVMDFDEFMKRNPQLHNDLYGRGKELANGIDWDFLDYCLKSNKKYEDCTSLYQILYHYKEIISPPET